MTIKATHTQTHTFVTGALCGPWWKWKLRKYLVWNTLYIYILNHLWDDVCASASCFNDNQSHSKRSARKRSAWTPLIAIWSRLFFQTEHHSLISALNTFCQFIFNYCLYEFEFLWLSSGHCFSHAPFITSYFGLFDRWAFLMIWCVYNWKATTLRSSFIWLINSADG